MKINTNKIKIITEYQPISLQIEGITLLSIEEAKQVPENLRAIDDWYWLRTPGGVDYCTMFVGRSVDRSSYFGGSCVNYQGGAIRPVLRIDNRIPTDLIIGDKIEHAVYTWTVIADDLILCDEAIGYTAFRTDMNASDANDYEASDVKRWLEKWARGCGII